MRLHVLEDPLEATARAADLAADVLTRGETRNVMLAGGNTPLPLYAEIARRGLDLTHLTAFALDEYVGVPLDEPRNCANLIRRAAVESWGIPESRYHSLSSRADEAVESILRHERLIDAAGGLDLVILGLGRNGHIGFNEPGSQPDSPGRVLSLEAASVNANREWFSGRYAPDQGVTTGMRTLLAARTILLLAFGDAKSSAVRAMVTGAPRVSCPASWLRAHPDAHAFLDRPAASRLPDDTTERR